MFAAWTQGLAESEIPPARRANGIRGTPSKSVVATSMRLPWASRGYGLSLTQSLTARFPWLVLSFSSPIGGRSDHSIHPLPTHFIKSALKKPALALVRR